MGGPRPFGIWAYGVPWGYISGDLLLRFRGDEASLRWVFIVSDTLAWTRTCKNKLYLQILQSHRDHYVVPLGCTGHASVHHRPTIESARLRPATNAGGPRRHDTCARVLSQQPGVLQQAFLPTVVPHRLRPRVGQPIPERPRSPPIVAPSPRALPIPERPRRSSTPPEPA
jgi:hypothetical protein